MDESSGPLMLKDVAALMAYLEVDTLEAAGDMLSEDTDPDAFLIEEDGEIVLRMNNYGVVVTFPLSVDDFFGMVDDLESDVVAQFEDDTGGVLDWDSPELFPASEPVRIARYRKLQSWYRATILHAKAGASGSYAALGSYLDADEVAANPRLNFLSDEALAHAEKRIIAVKAEGGTLDPTRLKHNMLSSMPLCFNLFGTMRAEPAFLGVFQQLFDAEATEITEMVCEWSPQPPQAYLGDRTAFDAIVFYTTPDGPRFCGVETKYTEAFSATEYDNPTYTAMTRESGWFRDPVMAATEPRSRKSNQLWRNVLLAAAVERNGGHGVGWVAVVALADDPGAAAAVAAVGSALTDEGRLKRVSFESIVGAAQTEPALASWAYDFRQRYLEVPF